MPVVRYSGQWLAGITALSKAALKRESEGRNGAGLRGWGYI
jgi:hypothetical protein